MDAKEEMARSEMGAGILWMQKRNWSDLIREWYNIDAKEEMARSEMGAGILWMQKRKWPDLKWERVYYGCKRGIVQIQYGSRYIIDAKEELSRSDMGKCWHSTRNI